MIIRQQTYQYRILMISVYFVCVIIIGFLLAIIKEIDLRIPLIITLAIITIISFIGLTIQYNKALVESNKIVFRNFIRKKVVNLNDYPFYIFHEDRFLFPRKNVKALITIIFRVDDDSKKTLIDELMNNPGWRMYILRFDDEISHMFSKQNRIESHKLYKEYMNGFRMR